MSLRSPPLIEDVKAAPCKEKWIANSGASQHMTFRRDWFTSFSDSDSEKFVKVANDERLEICGYGTILIDVLMENRWEPRRLEGVQYYVKKKFNMIDCTPISTPADPNVHLANSAQDKIEIQFPYREAAGFLMYAAIISRPDIAFAVGEVSLFLTNLIRVT
ncbi:hypothetical protein JTB14_024512 [Gonioctena quinquepunctata]|nr:hypothetical protein JTB14_024512 [Gonioctena quinquepunctata]